MSKNKFYAWVIGLGLVFFAIHNQGQPLIEYLFLPSVGLILSLMFTMVVLYENRKQITFGKKIIWIPLLILVACIGMSGVFQYIRGEIPLKDIAAPLVFGIYMFGVYLAARILKTDLILPFTVFTILECLTLIVGGLSSFTGKPFGGMLSPTNYDIATGFVIFGTIISRGKYQWLLVILAVIALIFTGAEEAIFGCFIIGVSILIRRDWDKRLWFAVIALIIVLGGLFITGIGQKLYFRPLGKIEAIQNPESTETHLERYPNIIEYIFNNRFRVALKSLEEIKVFGHGYSISKFTYYTVHNIPLVIVQQIGLLGALAWTFITLYCLIKSKWRYVWIMIVTLSVFDHYLWTQIGIYYFMILGITTSVDIKNDFIFKKTIDK